MNRLERDTCKSAIVLIRAKLIYSRIRPMYVLCKALLHCAIFSATCIAIFFVARSVAQSRTQLYFSQRIAAIDNTIAQCITPPAACPAILRQF